MASTKQFLDHLLERRAQQFDRAESEAVRLLLQAGLFCEIDPRLLGPDTHFAAPSFLPIDALAERARGQIIPDAIQIFNWRHHSWQETSAVEAVVQVGKTYQPATAANLLASGQLPKFLQSHQFRRCILTGTGWIDERHVFHHLVIDFIQPDNDFVVDEPELTTGPILRPVAADLETLRSVFFSIPLFVSGCPAPTRRSSP